MEIALLKLGAWRKACSTPLKSFSKVGGTAQNRLWNRPLICIIFHCKWLAFWKRWTLVKNIFATEQREGKNDIQSALTLVLFNYNFTKWVSTFWDQLQAKQFLPKRGKVFFWTRQKPYPVFSQSFKSNIHSFSSIPRRNDSENRFSFFMFGPLKFQELTYL